MKKKLIDEKLLVEAKRLVSTGKILDSIDLLLSNIDRKNSIHNKIIILRSRIERINEEKLIGICTPIQYESKVNSITHLLLELIDSINNSHSGDIASNIYVSKIAKYVAVLVFIITVIIYSIDHFGKKPMDTDGYEILISSFLAEKNSESELERLLQLRLDQYSKDIGIETDIQIDTENKKAIKDYDSAKERGIECNAEMVLFGGIFKEPSNKSIISLRYQSIVFDHIRSTATNSTFPTENYIQEILHGEITKSIEEVILITYILKNLTNKLTDSPESAQKYIDEQLIVNPEILLLSSLKANLYVMQNKIDSAYLELEKIVEKDPYNYFAYYNMGIIQLEHYRNKNKASLYIGESIIREKITNNETIKSSDLLKYYISKNSTVEKLLSQYNSPSEVRKRDEAELNYPLILLINEKNSTPSVSGDVEYINIGVDKIEVYYSLESKVGSIQVQSLNADDHGDGHQEDSDEVFLINIYLHDLDKNIIIYPERLGGGTRIGPFEGLATYNVNYIDSNNYALQFFFQISKNGEISKENIMIYL